MEGEERIQYWFGKLKHYRNDFSDEIPDYEVDSISENSRYKCRRVWWMLWCGAVDQFEKMGILPKELSKQYHQVFDDYRSKIEQDAWAVKPEDIRKANELLDNVLNTLEARLGQNPN